MCLVRIFISIFFLACLYAAPHIYKAKAMGKFYSEGQTVIKSLASRCQRPMLRYSYNSSILLQVPLKQSEAEDLHSYTLTATNDTVLDHSDGKMIFHHFTPPDKSRQTLSNGRTRIFEITRDNKKILTFTTEIVSPVGNAKLGNIYISYDVSKIDRTARIILIASLIACVFLIFIVWYFPRPAIGPIKNEERRIQNFILLDPINSGGMAKLWTAIGSGDNLKKKYAIKLAKSDLTDEALKTFDDEARLASLMEDHPNIVNVLFYYQAEHAIVMDYIEGHDLEYLIAQIGGKLNSKQVGYIITEICSGLQHAHSLKNTDTGSPMKIVHRDIKPGNILISNKGKIKITDFGIAKANIFDHSKTQVGEVKGTLPYMSPEQARGEKDIDHRSDIYSLGIVFHEIITGKQVHNFDSGINFIAATKMVSEKEIPPIIEVSPGSPEAFSKIVMKCLEKDKSLRYQNVEEIIRDFVSFFDRSGIAFPKADTGVEIVDMLARKKNAKTLKNRVERI